ncbi:MAG: homoserine kinase [Pseudobdellovibrionaceae bacterium]
MIEKSASAFAPASVANVAVGFDIMGFSFPKLGDIAHVSASVRAENDTSSPVQITKIIGLEGLSLDPKKNTATAGLLALQKDHAPGLNFKVSIEKGIPLCSGLGGSAASAVAALVAANELLDKPLSKQDLLPYTVIGESVASGSFHADNVAPSLFGGLILLGPRSKKNQTPIIALNFPQNLFIVIAYPNGLQVATQAARASLKPTITLKEHTTHNAKLAAFILGCERSDFELIQSGMQDLIIEPQRQHLIAGFAKVKEEALQLGALGFSISGSGPTVFAWTKSEDTAQKICAAIEKTWPEASEHKVKSVQTWVSSLQHQGAYKL